LTSEDRRLTKLNFSLDPNNIRNQKKSGNAPAAKVHDPAVSETRASFQIPSRSRSRSKERNAGYTSYLSNRSRKKRVTFNDQNNTRIEGYELEEPTNARSKRNVIVDANPRPAPILKRKESEKQLLYVVSGFTALETPNSPAPLFNEFVHPSELSYQPHNWLYRVDMSGFHSQNLAFYVKGTRLIVEGMRPKKDPYISSRRTQEIVQLPPGVHGDNLKVARDEDGMLIFEEAWKF